MIKQPILKYSFFKVVYSGDNLFTFYGCHHIYIRIKLLKIINRIQVLLIYPEDLTVLVCPDFPYSRISVDSRSRFISGISHPSTRIKIDNNGIYFIIKSSK